MKLVYRDIRKTVRRVLHRGSRSVTGRFQWGFPALSSLMLLEGKRGEIHVWDFGGFQSRHLLTNQQIEAALPGVCELNDFEPIVLSTDDNPHDLSELILSYSGNAQSNTLLIPDFVFLAWPEAGIANYEKTVSEMVSASRSTPERQSIGWIGNVETHANRRKLADWACRHPNTIDFRHVSVPSVGQIGYMTLADQVKTWQALIDIEGRGYSGRLKLLLRSGRPVVVIDRPCYEYWWEPLQSLLAPFMVKRDLSNLGDVVSWVLNSGDAVQSASGEILDWSERHLTYQSAEKRWSDVLAQIPMTDRPIARRLRKLAQICTVI